MCKKVHCGYLKVNRGKQLQIFGSIEIKGRELQKLEENWSVYKYFCKGSIYAVFKIWEQIKLKIILVLNRTKTQNNTCIWYMSNFVIMLFSVVVLIVVYHCIAQCNKKVPPLIFQ